jgi:hypothetical protein
MTMQSRLIKPVCIVERIVKVKSKGWKTLRMKASGMEGMLAKKQTRNGRMFKEKYTTVESTRKLNRDTVARMIRVHECSSARSVPFCRARQNHAAAHRF